MSKNYDICSMNLKDECTLQSHCSGQQVENMEKSVYMESVPEDIRAHTFIDLLQEYGSIRWHTVDKNSLVIKFNDRTCAETLLNMPVWISDVKCNIKKEGLPKRFKKAKLRKQKGSVEKEDTLSYCNIKHVLKDQTTFDDQLVEFIKAVQLTDAEIEAKYEFISTHLSEIFKAIFPKCEAYKYGSTQTGLGFKGCDLDVYLDIGEQIEKTERPSSWSMMKIFKEMKWIMYRMSDVFSNVVCIPKARIPIIKFVYVRTNVSCDVSFKNRLGVCKSYLIEYYISLDNRLKPLIMFIKYWARLLKLVGPGKLSNYALTLLIIFYLQQPSVNIVPPVKELQQTCQPQIVKGWQVNFDQNRILHSNTNTNSIPQLIHNFFLFYTTFNAASYVICPLDGIMHSISEFKNVESLPQCMDRYKEYIREDNRKFNINKPLRIQDPIELNHNVATRTRFLALKSFENYCKTATEICRVCSKNDYRDLMDTLFTSVLKTKATNSKLKE